MGAVRHLSPTTPLLHPLSLQTSAGEEQPCRQRLANKLRLVSLSTAAINFLVRSRITLQPKTGFPLKLSRVKPGQYLDGRPPGKTRLLLEEVLVRPAGGCSPLHPHSSGALWLPSHHPCGCCILVVVDEEISPLCKEL